MHFWLEQFMPENHASAIPNTDFENVLGIELFSPGKKPCVFFDQLLRFIESEALVPEFPVIALSKLQTKDQVI
jgi:hypothetical protein